MEVDPETNELYIADGYLNKRIIVFDADTGEYRRHWGAYGNEPSDEDTGSFMPGADPIAQFRTRSTRCASRTTGWSMWPTG